MKKTPLRHRIALYTVIGLITVFVVLLILVLIRPRPETKQATMKVAFGSLSSNLSSVGTVSNLSTEKNLPLAFFTEQMDSLTEEQLQNGISRQQIFLSGGQGIFYEITEVREDAVGEQLEVGTEDEPIVLMTLSPLRFNWTRFAADRGFDLSDPEALHTAIEWIFDSSVPVDFLPIYFKDYIEIDPERDGVVVSTERISELIREQIPYSDSYSYTIFVPHTKVGDRLTITDDLLKVGFCEWYTSFTLSEYDIPFIYNRMQNNERVYAAVGINALNGRKLLAEITNVASSGNSSGVSFFRVSARLVFPKVSVIPPEKEGDEPTEKGDYSYYDSFLSDTTVTYLGVNLANNLDRESLLNGYSVTVTAQKTVIPNTLIVSTKCIYYDDAKTPYVIRVGADNKESRIYINITLSTGTDAAVTAAEGYSLHSDDNLRYTTTDSLLQSLF